MGSRVTSGTILVCVFCAVCFFLALCLRRMTKNGGSRRFAHLGETVMGNVFAFDGSHHRWWRGGVNSGLLFLMRELLMKCLRTLLITERSSLIAVRCRLKIGAYFEPWGKALSQIGLRRASFMGSGFTGGASFQCINCFRSRARCRKRMLEIGTAESRGEKRPCF